MGLSGGFGMSLCNCKVTFKKLSCYVTCKKVLMPSMLWIRVGLPFVWTVLQCDSCLCPLLTTFCCCIVILSMPLVIMIHNWSAYNSGIGISSTNIVKKVTL